MKIESYKNLEKDLDAIVISELNYRFRRQNKPSGFEESVQTIENRIRQIVEAHQNHTISSALPSLFTGFLQLKENGILYYSEHDLRRDLFDIYADCRSRFDVLFAASLNALESKDLVAAVSEKKQLFVDKYEKIKELQVILHDVNEIQDKANQLDAVHPRDESESVRFLKDIAPLRTALQFLESRYLELKDDLYTEEPSRQIRQALNHAAKLISDRDRNASGYIMEQASGVFHQFQSTPVSVSNTDRIVLQKEELLRYADLFGSIGDIQRKEKVSGYADTIDRAIMKLREDIGKQKAQESVQIEKQNREADEAYQTFLEIKESYKISGIASEAEKKYLASKLNKCLQIFKSHGQRVRAREIERFINSTGVNQKKKPQKYGSLPEPNLFYKKAFFAILPITVLLLILLLFR